ncbi:alpha/beta fold hydrolase [Cryobacterium sp. SO1]|uniref:alpha/beta fold hydrolase n=1 Tax=Cryobacterium sp. SO1 TaxID=1897061 RepID=UPI0010238244|nr:alpha/beta hydrolase [Cryobacterium sp. SO1]RZI35896.1 Lipase 3 [Cryobacterium sp. SO1]
MIVPSPYADLLTLMDARAHTLAVSGSDTRYWEYGDPDSPTTVVMVHGFRGDHHGLEAVVSQLRGLRIISPDLPGFGESAAFAAGPHSIDAYAAWLAEFLRLLALPGRLVVLGHSFGSIVVSAAAASPDGLPAQDLVLVNPIAAPALSGPRGLLTRLAVFYYWLASKLPERLGFGLLRNRAIVRVMSITMAKTRNRQRRRWIHNQHDRYFSAFADRTVVLEAFRASVGHDVSEYATDINIRTLLIAAEKDDITPLDAQVRLRAQFPEAQLHVLPGVGHLIHYEVPENAARELRRFLEPVVPAGEAS